MSRLSKITLTSIFFLFLFLLFSFPLSAKTTVEYQGKSFTVDVETIETNGETYLAVGSLFKQMGGVEYYSPIMKKVNLFFGGKSWVLSLDKGKAVAEGEEDIPLGRSVVIQNNTVYVSPQLLNRLFGLTTGQGPTPLVQAPTPEMSPSPTPTMITIPSGTSSLLNVRSYASDQEKRSRITFDFGQNLPTHTMQMDQANNRVILTFNNVSLAPGTPSSFNVNDNRVNRIELQKKGNTIEAIIYLKSPATISKNQLGGDSPRVYLDITSSTLLTSPTVTVAPVITTPETKPTSTSPTTPKPVPSIDVSTLPFNKINPKVIVIDPGHGGKDPGCVVNGYQEKNIVLQVAKKLQEALVKRGYEVYLTRESDSYPSLKERAAVANNKQPVVLLSIHANSSPSKKATGVEIFIGSAQYQGEGAQDVANRENQSFIEEGHTPEQNNITNTVVLSSLYVISRDISKSLGDIIEKSMVKETGQVSRGLKEAPLILLKGMYFPSCLIEIGFLSNPTEAKNLANSAFQDKLVRGMVTGIEQFLSSADLKKLLED